MKVSGLLIALLVLTDPLAISKINSIKSEARKAYQAGDYKTAVDKYAELVKLGVKEDEVMLNLANAYYLQKDTANAFSRYQSLTQSNKKDVSAKASNQLGLMLNERGKPEEALSRFKNAIKSDPGNNEARYNYEMLKKKLDQAKDDQKNNKDKNKDQNKKQDPSEFAKKLKVQADELVAGKRYREAFNLMTDGMKKDQTVSAYQTFIDRTKDIADINQQ
jgi:hypothetical protein